MTLVMSKKIIFESSLDSREFIRRLVAYTEPDKKFIRLDEGKCFVGKISNDGIFDISYLEGPQWISELSSWGGPRLEGTVSPYKGGSLVKIKIKLPRMVVAGGLAFAWGTFVIGLTGIIIISESRQYFSIVSFLKMLGTITIPCVFSYCIFFLNLKRYSTTINEFLESNLKR